MSDFASRRLEADLVAWLRQQLDADEAVARHAFGEHNDATPEWEEIASGCLSTGGQDVDDLITTGDSAISRHMERWDPSRVLAEVAAKRRILNLHATLVRQEPRPPFDPMTGESQRPQVDVNCEVCGWVADDPLSACSTVRLLALPFADRAGYRPEWHPDREGDDRG